MEDIFQPIDDKEKKKSYDDGYYIKGSRSLAGEFEKVTYSPEKQRNFGINDLNNGLKEEYLFNLKVFPNYMNSRIYQMERNIYYYIIENNIQIKAY